MGVPARSQVSVVSPNLTTIAALAGLSRHAVEDIIHEVVQVSPFAERRPRGGPSRRPRWCGCKAAAQRQRQRG